jgi:hypothetical protein
MLIFKTSGLEILLHRDIRILRRDNTMQIIQDSHRSYDALQFPLIFWEGEDGYHLNIKQRNPTTGKNYKLCLEFCFEPIISDYLINIFICR